MPGLNDMYPNSVGWVVAVACVGAVISVVAAFGYKTVSRVANIAAPWMVLVFLAFGVIGITQFIGRTGAEITSAGDLWELANKSIWKGGAPLEGQAKFTIWHVTFFAWFCNMAMHIGMSDLTVFRYAKKSWYGLASATGMYVGHFMAWIAASILYAYQLDVDPTNTDVLPGPMAFAACGWAGLVCVIIAGWTTANPTIYRAGLAFQAIMPKRSRFAVTLFTGGIATVAAMFPAIAMKLLGFVALYGLVLMPMGAVVFVDFYLMKKLGLKDNYAERSKQKFNWAAGLTWFVTFGVCLALVFSGIKIRGVEPFQIYFVSLPGWFLAVLLYVTISAVYQTGVYRKTAFRFICQIVSWAALIATVVPGIGFLTDHFKLEEVKIAMTVATVVWFIATPLWMGLKTDHQPLEEDELVI